MRTDEELSVIAARVGGVTDAWDRYDVYRAVYDVGCADEQKESYEKIKSLEKEVKKLKRVIDEFKRILENQLHYDMKKIVTGTPENRSREKLREARAQIKKLENELTYKNVDVASLSFQVAELSSELSFFKQKEACGKP